MSATQYLPCNSSCFNVPVPATENKIRSLQPSCPGPQPQLGDHKSQIHQIGAKCSTQDILLNYTVITVSALQSQDQAIASWDCSDKYIPPNKKEIISSLNTSKYKLLLVLVEMNHKTHDILLTAVF